MPFTRAFDGCEEVSKSAADDRNVVVRNCDRLIGLMTVCCALDSSSWRWRDVARLCTGVLDGAKPETMDEQLLLKAKKKTNALEIMVCMLCVVSIGQLERNLPPTQC